MSALLRELASLAAVGVFVVGVSAVVVGAADREAERQIVARVSVASR